MTNADNGQTDDYDDHDHNQNYKQLQRDKRAEALGDLLLADVLGLKPGLVLQQAPGQNTNQTKAFPSLAYISEHFKTKSAAIRWMHDQKFSVNEISKHLGLRYQHVRNVLKNELKRGPHESYHLQPDISNNNNTDEVVGNIASSIAHISNTTSQEDEA